MTEIDLVSENGFHRHIVPVGCFAPQIFASLSHIVKASGGRDFFCVELQGDFAKAVALQTQVKDAPRYRGSHRIDLKDVLVLRAFAVAKGRIAAHILP